MKQVYAEERDADGYDSSMQNWNMGNVSPAQAEQTEDIRVVAFCSEDRISVADFQLQIKIWGSSRFKLLD